MDKITIELHIKMAETEIKLTKTLDLALSIEHFLKDLLGQISPTHTCVEFDELDDIAGTKPAT